MNDQIEIFKARLRATNNSIEQLKKCNEQKISQKSVQIGLRMLEEQKELLERKISGLTKKEYEIE